MAQNQANFGLNFKVDKSGLNELKKSLQDIIKLGNQSGKAGGMTDELKQACQAAKQLESILDGAWNSKLGQLNLDKVNQGIKTTYGSVGQLRQQLESSGNVGTAAYNKMASQILSTNLQLKQSNKLLDDMATSMANTVKWGITSSIFNNMTRSVQDAFYYVKNLDSSLNDIRIVTGASADQMAAFAEKANIAAKALGQSTRAYTDASLIYYQQGLSEADVAARAETTLKAANVTGQSTDEVSELLTSVWNGYKVSAAEAELYIDKIAAVAATTASDLEELSVGMSKVASAASLMGVDIDQLNAQLATIISVTRQAPESVGTALKTIYARMGDIEAGLDGETTLGNYTEQMKEMGFNVLDAQGKLRDMGSVIEEIGSKWGNMTREQQLSLAQTVAGTRQYNNLLALFDNWDMYTDALNTSNTAMGTLQEQQDVYMESTKAHLQELSTELERTYSSLLDTDTLNTAVDGLTGLVEQFNAFIDGLGGGGATLAYFGSMAVNVFSKQIGSSITKQIANIDSLKANLKGFELKQEVIDSLNDQHLAKGEKLDDSALVKEAEYAEKTLQIRKALTQEQYDQFTATQSEIGLKENELNYLREYKNISQEILDDENATLAMFKERLKYEQKELEQAHSQKMDTSKGIKTYNVEKYPDNGDIAILQERLSYLQSITKEEENRKLIIEAISNLKNGQNITEEQTKAILNTENEIIQKQKTFVDKIIQGLKGRQAAEEGTLDILEEEQAARERILQQQQQQAEKQLKIQKAVRAVGTALEIGTALVNAMAVGFDKTASGAEKANAVFSGLTGVAAGIANYFAPGTGILVQGVTSLIRAGLEAAGAWDWIEDRFKSTAEKIAEIDDGVSKNNTLIQQTNSQISSLKAIEEEYAMLSEKAGQYGENLDKMTEEEQARYHELTSAFTQYNDEVILGYDIQGNAIVNNQNALQKTIELLECQRELEARENLGNIKSGIKSKDKEIANAQAEVEALNSEAMKSQIIQDSKSDLSSIAQQFQNELWALDEAVLESQVKVQDTEMSVAELVQDLVDLTSQQTPLDESSFNYIIDGMNALKSALDESDFKDYKGILWERDVSAEENFQNYLNGTLQSFNDFIANYEHSLDQAVIDLETANQKLRDLQVFDINYIMQILQYGEGYDTQWDALSYEGQEIGYNLVLKYLTGIQYGTEEGQADSYADVIKMGQDFLTGLNEAINVGMSEIESAAEDFNESNFEGTIVEREQKIKEIIIQTLDKIDTSGLDEAGKKALETMFEDAFNVDLTFDDSGSLTEIEDTSRQYLEKAKEKIQNVWNEKKGTDIYFNADNLLNILDTDQIKNIDNIIANIDWSQVIMQGQSVTEAIAAAAQVSEQSIPKIQQYKEALNIGEQVTEKLKNAESLNQEERDYLDTLEQEYPLLKKLGRGTDEYSEALEKIQKDKKNDYSKVLTDEAESLKNQIEDIKNELEDGTLTDEAKVTLQANLTELESELANTEYEIAINAKIANLDDFVNEVQGKVDEVQGIRDTLANQGVLTTEQATALANYGMQNPEIAAAIEEHGLTSQETITLLDQLLIDLPTQEFAKEREALAQSIADKEAENEQLKQKLQEQADILKNPLSTPLEKNMAADQVLDLQSQIHTNEVDIAASNYQMESLDVSNIVSQVDSLNELNTLMAEGTYSAEALESAMDGVVENILEAEDIDIDGFEDYVDVLEEMYEQTDLTTTQIKKMAVQDKILQKGLDKLTDSFDDWSKSVKDNKKGNTAYSDTMSEVIECVEDLTGLTVGSDFLDLDTERGLENLKLLQAAMSGSQEDLLNLQRAALEDIVIGMKLDPTKEAEVMNEIANLYPMMQSMLDSGELVVGQNINDGPLLAALSNIVSACASTRSEAEAMLAKLGFDAEVVEEETPPETFTSSFPTVVYSADGEVPVGDSEEDAGRVMRSATAVADSVEVTTTQGGAKATALKVKSATYTGGGNITRGTGGGSRPSGGGSGGGGGGGGGKGKTVKKPKARKKDYYHDVNNSIKKLSNAYEKLAEIQDKTFGKQHIENIKNTNENLDKQIDKMRERIKIAQEQEKVDLKKEITSSFKGVKFNKDGTIKNYESILSKYYKKYQNAKTQDAQDEAKEKYDELKELLDNYETLILETIPGWEAEIREKIDEKYENIIHQFEYEIEMRTNFGESEREMNEFLKEFKDGISDIDFLGQVQFEEKQFNSFLNSKEVTSKTRQLQDAMGELDKINSALEQGYSITKEGQEQYFSDVWGDNKAGLMEYIRTLQSDLMSNLQDMWDARQNAYDTYLDAIDDGIEKFDKHIEQYELINEEIEHNMNLIEMLYGETSEMMGAQYDLQEANYLGKIQSLKQISEVYKTKWDEQKQKMAEMEAAGDTTSNAYKEAKEQAEIYEEAYNETISNLNSTVEAAIQNLIDKYAYGVDQVLNNMATKMFGEGLNVAATQWSLLNEESEMYLDNINSAFEIQKLEYKYKEALNNTDSLTAQKKLNKVMEDELGSLREKDKLSQYEVDRANLIYELTLKQIALEEAQQNKSKMRLRRNAQGNYSYQFTADTEQINQAQEDVTDVLQRLTNLSQEKSKEIYDTALSATQDFVERMAEIEAMADGEEKDRLKQLTVDNYNRVMADLMKQSELVESHINELVSGPLTEIMDAEKQLFEGDSGISTQILKLTATLRESIEGEGGITEITGKALEGISEKASEYKVSLEQIEIATGKAFDKLSDEEYIKQVKGRIDDLTGATNKLASAWDTTLGKIKEVIEKMDEAIEKNEHVQAALKALEDSEKVEQKENQAAGDAAEQGNKEIIQPVPEPEPVKTETEDGGGKKDTGGTGGKKGTGNGKVEVGDKVTIKSSYAASKGGKYISNPKYKKGSKLYIQKISGSWVHIGTKKAMNSSTQVGWIKKKDISGYDTGGYTGNWNSKDGKLAFLHQKELVLNQKDTRNILDAVNIIRGLGGLLQNSMINRIESLTQSLSGISVPTVQSNPESGPQSVEQTVHITAEFPGATEAIQIEQALESLVNRASQYAFRTKE